MSSMFREKKLMILGVVLAGLFGLIFAANHWMSMELREATVETMASPGSFETAEIPIEVSKSPASAVISGPDPLAPVRKPVADPLPSSGGSETKKEGTIRIYELSTPSPVLIQ